MRRHLQVLLIVLLTGGLLAFFVRNADLVRVWEVTWQAQLDLVIIAIVLMAISYLIRVERWRRLLQTIGGASFTAVGRATVIGFAANALLPGRVGEVLRPYVLADREHLSASSAFGTIVVERLLDLLAILIMVSGCLIFFEVPTQDGGLLRLVRVGAITGGGGAVIGWMAIIRLVRRPKAAERFARLLAKVAPDGIARFLPAVIERFVRGLEVVRSPGQLVVATALSLTLWGCIATSIWVTSVAFGIEISFGGGVILMGLVAVGVSVPTPGGVGGYHAAYELGATVLYGAGADEAVGAALVTHMVAFGPVTLLGLVFMAQEGFRLTDLSAFRLGQNNLTGPGAKPSSTTGLGSSSVDVRRWLESGEQGGPQ